MTKDIKSALIHPTSLDEASDSMRPQEAIRLLLWDRFLLAESSLDSDPFVYEFGAMDDTATKMHLLALAFRCDQSTGARLVVSSMSIPKFVESEDSTEIECVGMTRYRLIVDPDKVHQFVDLLVKDLVEVRVQEMMLHESVRDRLDKFLMGQFYWFMGVASSEFVLAIIIAVTGIYLYSVEGSSTVALWGTLPVASLIAYRFVRSVMIMLGAHSKRKQTE